MVIPNTKQPARVMKKSVARRAFPMSALVYFFMIMAMISVPPLEAPMLNRIADPTAGRAMANASSRRGWSVSGCYIGQIRSRRDNVTDKRILL